MGEIKTVTFNSTYQSLRAFGGHRLHYQVHIDLIIDVYLIMEAVTSICLLELIKNLLNLQTTYPIVTNKSYQSFITDIVKLK